MLDDQHRVHYRDVQLGRDYGAELQVLSGLKEGDRWCLVAMRWQEALEAGMAPQVVLAACHEECLNHVNLDDLKRYAVDAE